MARSEEKSYSAVVSNLLRDILKKTEEVNEILVKQFEQNEKGQGKMMNDLEGEDNLLERELKVCRSPQISPFFKSLRTTISDAQSLVKNISKTSELIHERLELMYYSQRKNLILLTILAENNSPEED